MKPESYQQLADNKRVHLLLVEKWPPQFPNSGDINDNKLLVSSQPLKRLKISSLQSQRKAGNPHNWEAETSIWHFWLIIKRVVHYFCISAIQLISYMIIFFNLQSILLKCVILSFIVSIYQYVINSQYDITSSVFFSVAATTITGAK